jgi:hypothetical protein
MIGRRAFLNGLAAAGAGSHVGARSAFPAEQPPETTRLRIAQQPSICVAPQFIVTELLKAEGFTDKKHPIATKRALRAILKGADPCSLEPERAARTLVDDGFTPRYDYALQTMKDLPYNKWRVYDPEDSVRFYALRLREAGMIKSSPQKLIAQGTDWRFPNELKKELKG